MSGISKTSQSHNESIPTYNSLKKADSDSQKADSIFSDKNEDGIINEEDFNNNSTIVNFLQRHHILGASWKSMGKTLNNLLKHFNVDSNETETQALKRYAKECDVSDYASIASALPRITEALNQGVITEDEYNEIIKDLFKDELKEVTDDGKYILKDGTQISYKLHFNSATMSSQMATNIVTSEGIAYSYDQNGVII